MTGDDPHDPLFKALAHPGRREILDRLRDGPRTTGSLCADFEGRLDRCTVMQHLRVLERAELVLATREGRRRWNHLNAAPLRALYDRWIPAGSDGAVGLLSRMKAELEARPSSS